MLSKWVILTRPCCKLPTHDSLFTHHTASHVSIFHVHKRRRRAKDKGKWKKISLNREPSLEVLENWKEMNADEKKMRNIFGFLYLLGRESPIIQDPFKMPHGFHWTFFFHVKNEKQWMMKRRRQSPRKDDSRLVFFFPLYFGFISSICGSENSIVLYFVETLPWARLSSKVA